MAGDSRGSPLPQFDDAAVEAARPEKDPVDPSRPYAFHVERERDAAGRVSSVATLFLSNRECPFRCVMCDLWKHTTDRPVEPGQIPDQIRYGLERLAPEHGTELRHLKLYNSGNFFDRKAIPPEDRPEIARLASTFETVVVENHPALCTADCRQFADRLDGQLEIALGLETVHPEVLPALNKKMTVDDFRRAVDRLETWGIASRAFILLGPPFLSEEEGIEWALRSVEVAFEAGVRCCSVIPTRTGNGLTDRLQREGLFDPPSLGALERVLSVGVRMNDGRVFADLWDLDQFYDCEACGPDRRARLRRMNHTQRVEPPVSCAHCSGNADDSDREPTRTSGHEQDRDPDRDPGS